MTVPKNIPDNRQVALHWDTGCEALLFKYEDGTVLQAFTNGQNRDEYPLSKADRGARPLKLFCEVACNEVFGNDDPNRCAIRLQR